jgi:hypothetical protein
MARPSKSLEERIRERSFLARRHDGLLAGPLTSRPELQEVQAVYQAATSERERRSLALDFQQAVRTVRSAGSHVSGRSGMTASAPADFFARYLVHTKGPAAGKPFKLEPWQPRFVEEFSRVSGGGERIYKRGMLAVASGLRLLLLAPAPLLLPASLSACRVSNQHLLDLVVKTQLLEEGAPPVHRLEHAYDEDMDSSSLVLGQDGRRTSVQQSRLLKNGAAPDA